ncbi:MAG: hypothetical protein P4L76_07735 [Beijerinckiaceae bacterium]|nr:hypothetical protein [Beijerinckiaceae bacterium]
MGKVSGIVCATVILAMGSVITPAVAAVDGPFGVFDGSWTGSGTVTVKDGTRERLRCKARYQISAGGTALRQDLTCASDSYKFNVLSDIVAQGGTLSGTWTELTRNVSGQVTGRIDPKQISAVVDGVGFTAGVGIASRGARQSVQIRPTGTDITDVSVTMSKQ